MYRWLASLEQMAQTPNSQIFPQSILSVALRKEGYEHDKLCFFAYTICMLVSFLCNFRVQLFVTP